MGVQDPSLGMSVDAFVKYTTRYRRDKLRSDLKALQTIAEKEREAEKRKLKAQLAEKQKQLEQKKMLLEQKKSMKRRQDEVVAKMMTKAAVETKLTHETPRPPKQPKPNTASANVARQDQHSMARHRTIYQPKPAPQAPKTELKADRKAVPAPQPTAAGLDSDNGVSRQWSSNAAAVAVPAVITPLRNPQPFTARPIDSDTPFASSTKSTSALGLDSAAGDDKAARQTNQAPRLRSFELTVASADSPSGNGPEGAGIFEGFRRVFVRARSVQALLDGKSQPLDVSLLSECLACCATIFKSSVHTECWTGVFLQLRVDDSEREGVGLVVCNAKGREIAVDDSLRTLPGRATIRLVKQDN